MAFTIPNSPELDHVKNFQHIFQKCSLCSSMNHTLASEDQELHWQRLHMVQPPAKKQINYPSGAWSNRLQKNYQSGGCSNRLQKNKQIIKVVDLPTTCKKNKQIIKVVDLPTACKKNKQIIILVDGPTACKKPNRNYPSGKPKTEAVERPNK